MNTPSPLLHTLTPAASVLLAFALYAGAASAQSKPTLDLWDTCDDPNCGFTMQRVFTVDDTGGFVAFGELGVGTIPATGPGERTMWYPFRGAFRTGSAGGAGTTAWDDNNIGFYSFAGGYQSRASAYASFAFGDNVVVTGVDAAAFGASHTVSGTVGFSAGNSNRCTGFACVAMGHTNRATGQGSAAIGERNIAAGDWSVALGRRATACSGTNIPIGDITDNNCPGAVRSGGFTFGDASTTNYIGASANNQFNVRASGGYRLYTNAALTTGLTMAAGGSAWNTVSDRERKEHFADVDGEALLQRISLLPIRTWRYIDEEDTRVRHIGPVAQDWQALIAGPLDLNDEDLTINQGDYDGVNLAAIKALAERTERLDTENAELRAELAQLKQERLAQADRLQLLENIVMRLASGEPMLEAVAAHD